MEIFFLLIVPKKEKWGQFDINSLTILAFIN